MSGFLAGKVWQSDLDPHLKPLAAAMADCANDDGTSIYPSVEYVAWLLGRDSRSVQRGIKDLKEAGILVAVRHEKGGRNNPTHYHMVADNLPKRPEYKDRIKGDTVPPFSKPRKGDTGVAERVTSDAPSEPERVTSDAQRVTPVSPDPPRDPSGKNDPPVRSPAQALRAAQLADTRRLMQYLARETGPVANTAAQAKAVKWLLDRGYTVEQCEGCLSFLLSQDWRTTTPSWWAVTKEIEKFSKGRSGGSNKQLTDDQKAARDGFVFKPKSVIE